MIHHGDCRAILPTLEAESVHCCVTSPPYYGLRNYGCDGQLGLEKTPEAYVAEMVAVFREVRRVLRKDGTLWLNLGDSYASGGGTRQPHRNNSGGFGGSDGQRTQGYAVAGGGFETPNSLSSGLKPKDLIGIPWRVAFALQADGWYLRQDIIWHKPNPMPESVTDRCTKAHEYIFLLSKSQRYHYDADALREPHVSSGRGGFSNKDTLKSVRLDASHKPSLTDATVNPLGRNRRSVWSVTTRPYKGAHFATFPPKLIEPCILAGCPEGGTVLDPFAGSGTTGAVAKQHNREFVGIELNTEYIELAEARIGAA